MTEKQYKIDLFVLFFLIPYLISLKVGMMK